MEHTAGFKIHLVLFTCLCIMTGIFTEPGRMHAFNPDHLAQVYAPAFFPVMCQNCDLSGADLSRANLFGANLSGADLSGANLTGANLTNAVLSGANLTGANLIWPIMRNTDLSGADLTGANLTGSDLSTVVLSRATWRDGTKCKEGSIGLCNK